MEKSIEIFIDKKTCTSSLWNAWLVWWVCSLFLQLKWAVSACVLSLLQGLLSLAAESLLTSPPSILTKFSQPTENDPHQVFGPHYHTIHFVNVLFYMNLWHELMLLYFEFISKKFVHTWHSSKQTQTMHCWQHTQYFALICALKNSMLWIVF